MNARLIPGDIYDDSLVAEVHPRDWANVTPAARYHLVVIGAGTGGSVTAAGAAGLGARVALVEQHLMGGDCLNVGCVPSKALIEAARAWHTARHAAPDYGGPSVRGEGSFTEVMARMRRLRARIARADSADRYRSLGVDVFLGRGIFAGPDRVEVDDSTLRFRRAVIATGARASVPGIPGLDSVRYYTNESIFTLTARPATLTVIGAGPIGCELAQAFQRLGVQVTLIANGERVLPRDDAEASAILAQSLAADGVEILTSAKVERVERAGEGAVLHLSGAKGPARHDAECVLVATGRRPNVEDMGLERAGVAFGETGVTVDDRLRTTNRRIYAVGDVCSRYRFTHVADFHARLVVQNALFPGRKRVSKLVIPWATYTDPAVAHVGLSEDQARARGTPVDIVKVDLDHVDRAILSGHTAGFLKLLLAPGSDRILGATVVARHAGDLIAEVTAAITNGLGLGALGRTIHPYPTTAEIFRKAADQWQRRKLTPTVRRLLAIWFSLT